MVVNDFVNSKQGVLNKPAQKKLFKRMKRHWQFYVMVLFPVAFLIVFNYAPMFGAVLAFKNYNVVKGILGSPWAGLKYFNMLFTDPEFPIILRNTLEISLSLLIFGFPAPLILALALNEVRIRPFKRTVQMVTYAPYFISTVVMGSMIIMLLDPNSGLVNEILNFFGMKSINFLGRPDLFVPVYVVTDIWQTAGYSAVIFLAALAGIDPSLYEAAKIDGASKWQKIIHVDLPGILPTVVILLILSAGNIMGVAVDKILLLQNPLNLSTSEVISTYVYKMGLINDDVSFAAAIGLFNSAVNLVLILIVNTVAKRVSKVGLW
ncbi:ABC transporter permease [Alicyclobacillus fodiniaquatilis]|uniref:ABC transporter permease n=1 Tax=Alicyclobacillus fodiniaquatilis TaxID=1661150 RepID=A0ABW4JL46_9BACL